MLTIAIALADRSGFISPCLAPRGSTAYHTGGCKRQIYLRNVRSSIKCERATKTFSSAPKPRLAKNIDSIAPHTRFHASARARPGFPCAPRNAPRRKGGPAEMAMARWPMAALLRFNPVRAPAVRCALATALLRGAAPSRLSSHPTPPHPLRSRGELCVDLRGVNGGLKATPPPLGPPRPTGSTRAACL